MTEDLNKYRETFRQEAYELLSGLEMTLLELEENPDDMELTGRVFRILHTIKGSGAMFGFDDIVALAHETEAIFDLVRNRKIFINKDIINLTLAVGDQIKAMLDEGPGDIVVSDELAAIIGLNTIITLKDSDILDLISEPIRKIISKISKPANKKEDTSGDASINTILSGKNVNYRIRFSPKSDIFLSGSNPVLLLKELNELGNCNVTAHTGEIPLLDDYNHEACYTQWDIILTTDKGINAIKDVFIFVEDDCDLDIQVIDEASDVKSVLAEQQHIRQMHKKPEKSEKESSIRVDTDKLDELVDVVGEFVAVQARLSGKASVQKDSELRSIAEDIERLTRRLRNNTMDIRMLPIGTTFNKFRRLVRDLSPELGKDVVMTTRGGETELDKTVIERLNDPLVHIIRNSIDHGIEAPDIRKSLGKPGQGTVELSAEHSGGYVFIQITDDGAGLDPEKIQAKAVKNGLIPSEAILDEKDIYSLIFTPGLSTVKKVTGVSGRGVGMDVVKRSIEALRGSVEMSSEKNAGTTITMRLPLTLAIIDVFLVKIGKGVFALPISVVEECAEMTRNDAERARIKSVMRSRDEIISYISLRERLSIQGEPPNIEQVVIALTDGRKVGFGVDLIIGQHQIISKPLNSIYKNVEGISGTTIIGDGTVALILDINNLTESCRVGGATA